MTKQDKTKLDETGQNRTRFVLLRPMKKRSFNLLCVFGSFFRTQAVNAVSHFISNPPQFCFQSLFPEVGM